MNTGYSISKTTGTCAHTGEAIEPGDIHYAALVMPPEDTTSSDGDGGQGIKVKRAEKGEPVMQRVDISLAAWDQGFRPPGLFGYWRTTATPPQQRTGPQLDPGSLTDLLSSTQDTQDPRRLALRYVITLMLMRKRMLRFDGVETQASTNDNPEQAPHDVWRLTPKLDPLKGPMGKWHPDATLLVTDPKLTEEQLSEVADQLAGLVEFDE